MPGIYVKLDSFSNRVDTSGTMRPNEIGATQPQRQWIGLSLSGEQVPVQPIPPAMRSTYIQTIDLEVGFLKARQEIAEQFSIDEMAHNFVRAFNGTIFAMGQTLVFDFHGQNLKAVVKGLGGIDLNGGAPIEGAGILFDKSDVNFIKAGDSMIKLKGSSKK